MTVTDITLIYFSIGAPFAVYQIIRSRALTATNAVLAAAAFFVWPAFAFRMLRRRFHTGRPGSDVDAERDSDSRTEMKIDSIRESLKSIAAKDLRSSTVFEFRDLFDRYVGLTLAANPKYLDSDVPNELFQVAGREDPELADACLIRRNRTKLSRHQNSARKNFLEFIDNLPDLSQRTAAATEALELACLLNDGTAVGHLDKILKEAGTSEGATWNENGQQFIRTTTSTGMTTLTAATGLSKTD